MFVFHTINVDTWFIYNFRLMRVFDIKIRYKSTNVFNVEGFNDDACLSQLLVS